VILFNFIYLGMFVLVVFEFSVGLLLLPLLLLEMCCYGYGFVLGSWGLWERKMAWELGLQDEARAG
jgi:hypothetical protein